LLLLPRAYARARRARYSYYSPRAKTNVDAKQIWANF